MNSSLVCEFFEIEKNSSEKNVKNSLLVESSKRQDAFLIQLTTQRELIHKSDLRLLDYSTDFIALATCIFSLLCEKNFIKNSHSPNFASESKTIFYRSLFFCCKFYWIRVLIMSEAGDCSEVRVWCDGWWVDNILKKRNIQLQWATSDWIDFSVHRYGV